MWESIYLGPYGCKNEILTIGFNVILESDPAEVLGSLTECALSLEMCYEASFMQVVLIGAEGMIRTHARLLAADSKS